MVIPDIMTFADQPVVYRQRDRQRAFDVARSRGGTQAMPRAERNRIASRQRSFGVAALEASMARGREKRAMWPSLRPPVRADAADMVGTRGVMVRRAAAASPRKLITCRATGRSFFSAADMLAHKAVHSSVSAEPQQPWRHPPAW